MDNCPQDKEIEINRIISFIAVGLGVINALEQFFFYCLALRRKPNN